jgi:Arc/MetJ-type ribon-helix-helix transcriptional regulator
MKRTTITLPEDIAEMVDSEARRRQTSVSEVIRQCIVLGLTGGDEKPREIPWAGLFHDPDMIPAARMEEVLEREWADDLDRDRR